MIEAKAGRYIPIDIIVMIYAAFNVVVLTIGHANVENGMSWLMGYIAYFTLAFSMRWVPRDLSRIRKFFRDVYPLLLLGPAYLAAGVVNRAIFQDYFDDMVLVWDRAVFGGHPNTYLAEKLPFVPLSEFLHFCYYFYLWLIPLIVLALFLQRKTRACRETTAAIIGTFYLCYMIFTVFPVQGPYYTFPRVEAPGALFTALVYATLERGAAVGTAFPSSHCAAAAVIAVMAVRHTGWRMATFVVTIVVGIVIATIYGGFHYAIDSLVGVVLGLGMGWLLPIWHRRWMKV